MKCENCFLAKWKYCWFTCSISNKTYEDGDRRIPKTCPYQDLTLKEIQKIKERKN